MECHSYRISLWEKKKRGRYRNNIAAAKSCRLPLDSLRIAGCAVTCQSLLLHLLYSPMFMFQPPPLLLPPSTTLSSSGLLEHPLKVNFLAFLHFQSFHSLHFQTTHLGHCVNAVSRNHWNSSKNEDLTKTEQDTLRKFLILTSLIEKMFFFPKPNLLYVAFWFFMMNTCNCGGIHLKSLLSPNHIFVMKSLLLDC